MSIRLSYQSSRVISSEDACSILSLRLLIARAASKDSLAWWDDDSFSAPASFVLSRVFAEAPALAARSLALRAALTRHESACQSDPKLLHLYRLDLGNLDRLALRFWPLLPIPMPADAITTLDALRQHLLELTGEPTPYTVVHRRDTGLLEIEIPPMPADISPLVHRARTFAWAYLESAPGRPVFPSCLEKLN